MSDVWGYFEKVKNNNIVTSVKCQYCEAKYGTITSTTSLRRHLMSVHASIYMANHLPKQNSHTYAEQHYITIQLAQWITVDLQSFNIVE